MKPVWKKALGLLPGFVLELVLLMALVTTAYAQVHALPVNASTLAEGDILVNGAMIINDTDGEVIINASDESVTIQSGGFLEIGSRGAITIEDGSFPKTITPGRYSAWKITSILKDSVFEVSLGGTFLSMGAPTESLDSLSQGDVLEGPLKLGGSSSLKTLYLVKNRYMTNGSVGTEDKLIATYGQGVSTGVTQIWEGGWTIFWDNKLEIPALLYDLYDSYYPVNEYGRRCTKWIVTGTSFTSVYIAGFGGSDGNVASVSLAKSSFGVTVGGTKKLTATVDPDDATDKTVIWSSDNNAIATVNDSGVVTGVAPGTTSITATATNGTEDPSDDKTATCFVTVTVTNVAVTGVSIDKISSVLKAGNTMELNATVSPNIATYENVTWSSGDNAIATVNDSGVVTGVAPGTTSITVTATNGTEDPSDDKTATCRVIVVTEGSAVPLDALSQGDVLEGPLKLGGSSSLRFLFLDKNRYMTNGSVGTEDIEVRPLSSSVTTISEAGVLIDQNESLPNFPPSFVIYPVNEYGNQGTKWIVTKADLESVHLAGIGGSSFVNVTGVSLDKSSVGVTVGGTKKLTAMVDPDNATDKNVIWSSDNNAIATVNDLGFVTGVAPGMTFITATATNGTGDPSDDKTATCFVTVTEAVANVAVTGVSLDKNFAVLKAGNTLELNATLCPDNATYENVTWSSGDNEIATVNDSGVVTGAAPGTTSITVTATNGTEDPSDDKTATCRVIVVTEDSAVSLDVLSQGDVLEGPLKLSGSSSLKTLFLDKNRYMTNGSVGTEDIEVRPLSSSVMTISEDGVLKDLYEKFPDFPPRYVIYPVNEYGIQGTKWIVTKTDFESVHLAGIGGNVTGVSLNMTIAILRVDNTLELKATVSPDNASIKTVTWSSSDNAIATVSETGVVTGIVSGMVDITATATNGTEDPGDDKTATCHVVVVTEDSSVAVTDVSLDKVSASLIVGDTEQLTATVSPDNATYKAVTWSSSDNTIATVNDTGVVTGVAPGSVVITATVANGTGDKDDDKTATCSFTVEYCRHDDEVIFSPTGEMKCTRCGLTGNIPDYGSGTSDDPWKIRAALRVSELPSGWYEVTESTAYENRISVNGSVNLILGEGTILDASQGIHVTGENVLTISGSGTLNATAPNAPDDRESWGCAGIGGNKGEDGGFLTIAGGNVNATGSVWGAGIGGGSDGGNGGNITICGGMVTAGFDGAYNEEAGLAAAIGGGDLGSGGTILITGGTVRAEGRRGSAGIGGGGYGSGGTITIKGGSVTAIGASYTGGRSAAGIGAGRVRNNATSGDSGIITIIGGTVVAVGGENAQAIGVSNEVAENDSGTLILGRSLKVTAGDSESTAVPVTGDQAAACRSPWARVDLVIPDFGKPDFILPAFLKMVKAEAFEGISATVVEVSGNSTSIGDRAFLNCPNLEQIRIPAGCVLGKNVFDGCQLVFVYGTVGSSAESYCNDPAHGNSVFVPVE